MRASPEAAAAAATAMRRCDELAACSEEEGRITRRYLSPAMKEAHGLLAGWMRSAGLAPRTDAAGNLIARRSAAPAAGRRPGVLLLGSHVDSVPGAGRYDGVLGVTTALAAVEALGREAELPFHVDVVAFSEEEGVRYATPYLGSRAVAGTFDFSLLSRTDAAGVAMEDAIAAFGLNPRLLEEAAYRPEDVLGFVEVHLEQGPLLEAAGRSVGVVSAVAGQSRLLLGVHGRTAHAGTQPMDRRADALVAAAGVVAAVRAAALAEPGLRATVGRLDVSPNTRNVVPGAVLLSLDVRHESDAARVAAVGRLLEQAIDGCAAEGCELTVEENQSQPAVKMDAKLAPAADRSSRASARRPGDGLGRRPRRGGDGGGVPVGAPVPAPPRRDQPPPRRGRGGGRRRGGGGGVGSVDERAWLGRERVMKLGSRKRRSSAPRRLGRPGGASGAGSGRGRSRILGCHGASGSCGSAVTALSRRLGTRAFGPDTALEGRGTHANTHGNDAQHDVQIVEPPTPRHPPPRRTSRAAPNTSTLEVAEAIWRHLRGCPRQ